MKELHVFRCGTQDLYGITQDASGGNLPPDLCSSRWMLVKTLNYDPHMPPWGVDIAAEDRQGALLAGLSQNGFFISEAGALPPELITPDPS